VGTVIEKQGMGRWFFRLICFAISRFVALDKRSSDYFENFDGFLFWDFLRYFVQGFNTYGTFSIESISVAKGTLKSLVFPREKLGRY
jgi:hypothetical protein